MHRNKRHSGKILGGTFDMLSPTKLLGIEACPPSPRPVSAPVAVSSSSDYSSAVRAMIDRFGAAEECAGAVAFLSSDDASFVTGETIVISGGAPSRL